MKGLLLHRACVIIKSLRDTEGGPTYGKMRFYKAVFKSLPSYSNILLLQYMQPVPTRYLICPENIKKPYKMLSAGAAVLP